MANSYPAQAAGQQHALSLSRRWPRHLVILAGIVALAAVLRFYALSRESLWFDEAFSASVADWDPRWIILKMTELGLRSTDRNVFNLLLHYVLLWGHSEVAVRAIPAISGVLSVAALYALGKRLMGESVGLLGAFLLCISPFHVWFSREGRGYALLTLLGILAAYFMLRALADNGVSSWAGYAILAALAAYTHSFGLLIIGALVFFALIQFAQHRAAMRTLVCWGAAQVALGVALIPLILEFAGQTTAGWGAWIGEKYGVPTLKNLAFTMGMFSFNTAYDKNRVVYALGLLVFGAICLAALVSVGRQVKEPEWWQTCGEQLVFALVYLAAPIGVLFVVSQITPLYLERYLLPFLPPYLLVVALGLLSLRGTWLRLLAAAAVLIVTLPALAAVYEPGQKEDWRGAASYVAARADDADVIVLYDAYAEIPFNFYYHATTRQFVLSRFAPDEEMAQAASAIASLRGRVWLVLSHADEQRMLAFLEAKPGLTRQADDQFLGVRVMLYEVGASP